MQHRLHTALGSHSQTTARPLLLAQAHTVYISNPQLAFAESGFNKAKVCLNLNRVGKTMVQVPKVLGSLTKG